MLTEKSLREHTNIHSLEHEYKCDVCVASFEVKADLKRHVTVSGCELRNDCFLPVFLLFSDGFSDCFLTVFLTVF